MIRAEIKPTKHYRHTHMIILYTLETHLNFSHSKVKWNGELFCNTINSSTVNQNQQQQFNSMLHGLFANYKPKTFRDCFHLKKVIYKHMKYCI